MKNFRKVLLSGFFLLATVTTLAQGKIKGKVIDGGSNAALPGANVVIKGSKTGTSTDFEGKFVLNAASASVTLTVTSVGYESKTITVNVKKDETKDLGVISLNANSSDLQEVVVKSSILDIAKDRKTPVAVSTIKAAEIQQKLGNQEFPEILKSTPSVYTSKAGGGFGDARINIRGFSQNNIAIMINGVPVNDMENGNVFWSNWAGLSDVTSAMQVQRGLGSSKLTIPSVGGTINVLTKSSDLPEGGTVATSVGNNNYLKTQASYNTGMLSSGLSASFLLSSTSGEGYVDGTRFDGRNYYFALGYKKGNHDLQFTMTGAPQWHDQRSSAISIATAQKYGNGTDPNRQYNSDWGYLGNEEMNMRRNYYHKPVMSINWDWKINETTKLSTVLYGSWGRGAGSNGAGVIKGFNYLNAAFRKADGTIDFDKIQSYNSGVSTLINGTASVRTQVGGQFENSLSTVANTTNGISRISSFNSHDWYGGIIDLNKKIGSHLTVDFGIDARTYTGIHFQDVNNLYGGTVFNANYAGGNNNANQLIYSVNETYSVTPSNNPFASSSVAQKIGYDYDGKVNWAGAFAQVEYSTDKLTAYLQGSYSQQGFKKVDRFTYLLSNPLSETAYENIAGYNAKGGLNYNLTANHSVFVNAGYYSRQPFFNAVYPNNRSLLNGNLTNEKITGYEAGYNFTTTKFIAKLNVYQTEWKDRYQRATDLNPLNPGGYFDYTGITEVHKGIELELSAKLLDKLKLNGMISVGDWQYKGNSSTNNYDASNNPYTGSGTSTKILYLDGVKVGNSAQTTAALGASYEVIRNVSIDANYNYIDKLFANISPANFTTVVNLGALQLPSFQTIDAGFSYKLAVGRNKANSVNFRANVNNLFDTTFIAESSSNQFTATEAEFTSNTGNGAGLYSSLPVTPAGKYSSYADYQNRGVYNGIDVRNNVFFGFGRTWNFGITYKF
jgi:CarboxypepD_reg-like domain/TonB dependent receptor/TonB-dependent Receptor Plug Domain